VADTLELVTMSVGAGTRDVGIFTPKVAEPAAPEEVHAGGQHGH
jgi:hypothetical protein